MQRGDREKLSKREINIRPNYFFLHILKMNRGTGKYYAVVVLVSIAFCANVAAKKKGMLEIVTTHLPEECSEKAEAGDQVAVHYVGKLEAGAIFDASRLPENSRDPIRFELGRNKVIKGWEQGIKGMCVGEQRKLIIPPHLGYGNQAQAKIPAESTLIFDVELMELAKPSTFAFFMSSAPFIVGPCLVVVIGIYLWYKASANSTQGAKVKKGHKQKKKK